MMTNTTLYDFQKGTYIPRSILPAHGVGRVSDVLKSFGWSINNVTSCYVLAAKMDQNIKVYENGWISA